MLSKRYNIKNWTRQNLRDWFKNYENSSTSIKCFRADQVFKWLYQKKAENFDQMLNIGKGTRKLLKDHFFISSLKVEEKLKSSDGSIKYRILLDDGNSIESVFLPHNNHNTICVSSQAGCAMGCDFCMTAKMGLIRNLEPSEIINQIFTVLNELTEEKKIRNIVFMGMGEPLMNYKNMIASIEKITQPDGLAISPSRITVSTSGIPKMIIKMADDGVKFSLAVSLHSARQSVREQLMPFAKKFPLNELVTSIKYWYEKTSKPVTYEYIVWKGFAVGGSHFLMSHYIEFMSFIELANLLNSWTYGPINNNNNKTRVSC